MKNSAAWKTGFTMPKLQIGVKPIFYFRKFLQNATCFSCKKLEEPIKTMAISSGDRFHELYFAFCRNFLDKLMTISILVFFQGFWIGLTDKYAEGNFYWVDETSLNSSIAFWGRNEPSNAFGGEDCVEMYTWWNNGLWNDNKCTTKRYFICEKESGRYLSYF